MENKFTVGEIAKLYHMSKQTLIFYDKIDLFKPKIVDSNNHYRYYTDKQLEVLDSILILKEIGVPLKEMRTFLENRSGDKAINLLQEQKYQIDTQIEHLKRISNRLEKKIETLEHVSKFEEKVTFETLPEEYLAIEKVKEPYTLLQTDIALKKILYKASQQNYPYYYQLGVMIPLDNLKQGAYTNAEFAFLPLEKKISDCCITKRPKGLYATIYHEGEYDKIGYTYQTLLKTIKEEGYTPKGYAYEYCVLDSLTSKTSEEYVTRIVITLT